MTDTTEEAVRKNYGKDPKKTRDKAAFPAREAGVRSSYTAKPLTRMFAGGFEPLVDMVARTVDLAFSSETPVRLCCEVEGEEVEYFEVLDHSPGAMRTERLNDGCALLFNHVRDAHLGVVEGGTGRIDPDRRGRAKVRFGKGKLADEKLNDVNDKILTKTSFGYEVYAFDVTKSPEGIITVTATDWEPHEISFVTVPADVTVGASRSKTSNRQFPSAPANEPTEERNMNIREYLQKRGLVSANATDAEVQTAFFKLSAREQGEALGVDTGSAVEAEQKRSAEILALGDAHKMPDQAREFVRSKKSVEEFKTAILEERAKNNNLPQLASHLDLSARDLKQYSLLRALRAIKNGDPKGAEFEFECSRTISDKLGKAPRGIFVPFDAHPVRAAHALRMQRDFAYAQAMERALNTGTGNQGGYLVGTMHLASEFIQVLRPLTCLGRLGARMLTGLVGNVDIPKMASSVTTYWIAEGGDVADSPDDRFSTVLLKPKTIASATPVTRLLRMQADPSVEALLIEDLAASLALAIDKAGIQGTGADNQPKGIINQTGINTKVIATPGAPTYAEIVGMETAVEADNALALGTPAYLTHPGVKENCKTTLRAANAGFIWDNNQMNGYQAESTNLVPADGALFGNFSDVIIGTWGVLDVKPDNAKLAASDGTVLRAFQDADVAVRHAEAFCKNA